MFNMVFSLMVDWRSSAAYLGFSASYPHYDEWEKGADWIRRMGDLNSSIQPSGRSWAEHWKL